MADVNVAAAQWKEAVGPCWRAWHHWMLGLTIGRHDMHWDLGLGGLALLAVIALGFGVAAGAAVGQGVRRRVRAVVAATLACFVVGLFTSEVLFGWATEEELQPNVDGLSRDEVLLSSVLTSAAVVLVLRSVARRSEHARERHARRAHAIRSARR